MRQAIKFGQSDFRRMREDGAYYVDKTSLVTDVLAAAHEVLLLPRPRRFGKTLNLSMLHAFFDDQQSSARLFEGLAVAGDAHAMTQLNRFPTLFLTLKDINKLNWTECLDALKLRISALVGHHRERVWPVADPAQKIQLENLHLCRANQSACEGALRLLTELLHKLTGEKVVVLIDEYDNPIHEARTHGYEVEIIHFMRNFMGAALKDNAHLQRSVVTGILRIGKESIYSGLNNIAVFTVLEAPFSKAFGFTEEEVVKVLQDCDRLDELEVFRSWYNGYDFGGTIIYNPWSILNAASAPAAPLQPYWVNTSGNELIYDLILSGNKIHLDDLENLLAGAGLHKVLDVRVALRELTSDTVWSLLLFSGYLTAHRYDAETGAADLTIPNREIHLFFRRVVQQWYKARLSDATMAMIPCVCHECRDQADAVVYPSAVLRALKTKGIQFKQCERSGQLVPIDELLAHAKNG